MKRMIVLLIALWLTGCKHQLIATQEKGLIEKHDYIVDYSYPSQSKNERIQFIIFHYTAAGDKDSLRLLTQGNVSAHYLIPSYPVQIHGKPVVFQLVSENQRAWHAGISCWGGRNNINDTSIGIEIVNDGFQDNILGGGWTSYRKEQKILVAYLAKDIMTRYQIKLQNILGHSDIAPLRKSDPGPLFPWHELAQQGIGAWPDELTVQKYLQGAHRGSMGNISTLQKALSIYGYHLPQTGIMDEETRCVIRAFQMHFRSTNFTGVADKETEAIARALVEKYSITY